VKNSHYVEGNEHYAAALQKCGEQPMARDLIEFFIKLTSTRIELDKGQWMDISPKAADAADWSLSTQGKCTGETTMSRWHRPVGENYAVRATFEFLTPLEKNRIRKANPS